MKKRGTKHGTGAGKWRVERRRKPKGKGYYYNLRERKVRSKNGKRVIRYRPYKGRKRR